MHFLSVKGLVALCLVHQTFGWLQNSILTQSVDPTTAKPVVPTTTQSVVTTTTGLSTNPDDIRFLFFKNQENMSDYKEIKYGDISSLEKSGFINDIDSVTFVIHGFLSNATNLPYPRNVIKAYLRKGVSSNFIAVEWNKLGSPPLGNPFLYPVAASNVAVVGERVGEMIHFMMNNTAISSPSKVHLVGHSLGSHVSSRAAHYFRTHNLTSVGRISGLDPAGPGFQYLPQDMRLTTDDATFVDTIHTSVTFGYIGDVGHVSFYPNNGGPYQPNCDNYINPEDLIGICSHNKVGEYFAYSILNSTLTACKCSEDWYDVMCHPDCNDTEIFGEYTSHTARGSYYLPLATTEQDLN